MNAFDKQNRVRKRNYCVSARVISWMLPVILVIAVLLVLGIIILTQKKFKDTSISIEKPQSEPKLKSKVENVPELKKILPKITFETLVHDYGDVEPNTNYTCEFKFTNTGNALLKIAKLRASVDVVAKLDKNKEEYAPGESGTLKVEWNSRTPPSVLRRQVVVHSNDRANPEITLTIKAKNTPKVTCEPNRLKILIDKDNPGCPKLSIRSLDGHPFSITGFRSTGDCIIAEFDPAEEATKFVLEPKINMEKLKPNLKGRINISTNHPDGDFVNITFDVLPEYTVSPPQLIVFHAEPEKPIVRKIFVFNNYGGDFEIESVSLNSDVIDIKVLKKTKLSNEYQLDLEISPSAPNGIRTYENELSINLNDGKKLTVRCRVFYRK